MAAKLSLDEDSIVNRYKSGESQQGIADDLMVCQATVSRILRRRGATAPCRPSGSAHSQWKGGRSVTDQGYVLVTCPEAYVEMADYRGYVLEHRLVMAQHLGRPLRSDETVHHIDSDRERNVISNLQLRIGRHGKGSAFSCLDCGSSNVLAVALAEED